MATNLRCGSGKLHGIMITESILEVSCRSRWCGYRRGVVVRHRFDIVSGDLIETLKYKEPTTSTERK